MGDLYWSLSLLWHLLAHGEDGSRGRALQGDRGRGRDDEARHGVRLGDHVAAEAPVPRVLALAGGQGGLRLGRLLDGACRPDGLGDLFRVGL